MTATWPLEFPGIRTTDKVTPKPAAKTAVIPKTDTAKTNNAASAMLAAEAAVAISTVSGKRVTTQETLSLSSLPLQKLAPRRKKI